MTTSVALVPAGTSSPVIAVTPLNSVLVAPQVLGGTVTLNVASNPAGPFTASAISGSSSAASFRPSVNSYVQLSAATATGVIAVSDIGAGQGTSPLNEPIVNCQAVCASPNTTSEVILYSFRLPPNFLKSNFRCAIRGTASFTNNANAKTLQVRINGIAGTLVFQSPALASNANFAFEADFSGIGDGATLKGLGAGSTGGFGLSTTALTTLAFAYPLTELEVVVTCTKATGADTFQLDSLLATLQQ